MRNLGLVIQREFVSRARSGGYIASTLVMMLLLLVATILPGIMQSKPLTVLVLDKTGRIYEPLKASVEAVNKDAGKERLTVDAATGDEEQLTKRAETEKIGLLIIDGTYPTGLKARFVSGSPDAIMNSGVIRAALDNVVRIARLQEEKISPAIEAAIFKPLSFEERQLTKDGGRSSDEFGNSLRFALSAVVMIYVIQLLNSQFVFQGVLEEKVSRVIEVMAASVRSGEMLAGKIIGLGALGFVQFLLLMTTWTAGTVYGSKVSHSQLPQITWGLGLLIFLFLVLGYLLSAAIMAAGAATISRMEDQQTVMMPLMMLQMLPYMSVVMILGDINGRVATVFSMIPVFSPYIMPIRAIMGVVDPWQVAVSIGLMVVTTVVVTWASGRVYRAAMLTYGSRPSMKQVLGYLKG